MIRRYMTRFMTGRYGGDQLNLLLIALYVILYVVFLFTRMLVFAVADPGDRQPVPLPVPEPGPPPGGERQVPPGRPAGAAPVERLPRPGPRQGAPLLQVPQLRAADAGAPGQGAHHRPLPVLRRGL